MTACIIHSCISNFVPGAAERHVADARGSGPTKGVVLVQSPFTLTAWQWPDVPSSPGQAQATRKFLAVPIDDSEHTVFTALHRGNDVFFLIRCAYRLLIASQCLLIVDSRTGFVCLWCWHERGIVLLAGESSDLLIVLTIFKGRQPRLASGSPAYHLFPELLIPSCLTYVKQFNCTHTWAHGFSLCNSVSTCGLYVYTGQAAISDTPNLPGYVPLVTFCHMCMLVHGSESSCCCTLTAHMAYVSAAVLCASFPKSILRCQQPAGTCFLSVICIYIFPTGTTVHSPAGSTIQLKWECCPHIWILCPLLPPILMQPPFQTRNATIMKQHATADETVSLSNMLIMAEHVDVFDQTHDGHVYIVFAFMHARYLLCDHARFLSSYAGGWQSLSSNHGASL